MSSRNKKPRRYDKRFDSAIPKNISKKSQKAVMYERCTLFPNPKASLPPGFTELDRLNGIKIPRLGSIAKQRLKNGLTLVGTGKNKNLIMDQPIKTAKPLRLRRTPKNMLFHLCMLFPDNRFYRSLAAQKIPLSNKQVLCIKRDYIKMVSGSTTKKIIINPKNNNYE